VPAVGDAGPPDALAGAQRLTGAGGLGKPSAGGGGGGGGGALAGGGGGAGSCLLEGCAVSMLEVPG
jgi:hypothetical protein